MAKARRTSQRSLFREVASGVRAMREHREGRLTPRTHRVEPIALPPLKPKVVRETREALQMSRQVVCVPAWREPKDPRALGAGRSKPNDQVAALIWLCPQVPGHAGTTRASEHSCVRNLIAR